MIDLHLPRTLAGYVHPVAPTATKNMDRKWLMQGQSNVTNAAIGLKLPQRRSSNRKKDQTMQVAGLMPQRSLSPSREMGNQGEHRVWD